MSTRVEKPTTGVTTEAAPGLGWMRRLPIAAARPRKRTRMAGANRSAGGAARYTLQSGVATGCTPTPPSPLGRIAGDRELAVDSSLHLRASTEICRAPAPGPHLGPGVRGGHG